MKAEVTVKVSSRMFAGILAASVLYVAPTPSANAVFIRDDVPVAEYAAQSALYPKVSGPAGYMLMGLGTPSLRTCSGTLVAQSLFLTAAHCVQGYQANNIFVGFGANFPSLSAPLSSNVSQIIINPNFTALPSPYDMAMLRLASPAQAAPAPLLTLNPINNIFMFEGYGLQGTSGNLLSAGLTPMPGANNGLLALNFLEGVTDGGYFTDVFDPPGKNLKFEGIGASGDSGAGAFLPFLIDGVLDFYLIGVLVGGNGTQIPTYGNRDFWTRVREPGNLAFLESFSEIDIVRVQLPEPDTLLLVAIAMSPLLGGRRRRQSGGGASCSGRT